MKRRAREACIIAFLLPLISTASCELSEVNLADADDLVVAEVVLRTDDDEQIAFLHRTLGNGLPQTASGARIQLHDDAGHTWNMVETNLGRCLDDTDGTPGTCYRVRTPALTPVPGSTYTIRIDLPGGGVIEGETTVPGGFTMVRPNPAVCRIPVGTTLEIAWSASRGSWVYVSEAKLAGLRDALRPQGIEVEDDPARFIGLSISASDTTIVFPTELGLFDRADPESSDALIAIRDGLPADVAAEVTVAAADRNYVNWVRGGQFNPSGMIQVPSLRGSGGTGVFGSIVVQRRTMLTTADPAPPCQ
jgi:hypothetical protein